MCSVGSAYLGKLDIYDIVQFLAVISTAPIPGTPEACSSLQWITRPCRRRRRTSGPISGPCHAVPCLDPDPSTADVLGPDATSKFGLAPDFGIVRFGLKLVENKN